MTLLAASSVFKTAKQNPLFVVLKVFSKFSSLEDFSPHSSESFLIFSSSRGSWLFWKVISS